ncbi:AAA family ATPase [Providencia stuartii]|uniref:AAA family ATPase n=1 Tax=Providencia stuartii TaxID=588 RepID=UPI0018C67057|nr:AAA family ATPase [Providencia stuartii]MBG5918808.1 AAA family ATPase [Providencia stuartii]
MKVCIIGISGAGKTTLAKKLSIKFNTPAYAYDDVYWDKSNGEYIKNTQEVMNSLISDIKYQGGWIVEGAYDRRMTSFFEECSLIIRLKTPYRVCAFRIIKRFLLARIARQKPKETLLNTIELLRFAKKFDNKLDIFFNSNQSLLQKVVEVNDINQCSLAINKHFIETA